MFVTRKRHRLRSVLKDAGFNLQKQKAGSRKQKLSESSAVNSAEKLGRLPT